ncbi:MAG: Mut7-C RNAse domain-containing protein [Desulfobacterales bacterium]
MPCFAAERTLGRLTKWLRLLGFDTLYQNDLPGQNFIDTLENDRILLTRTRWVRNQFASRRMIFVESDHLEQQLKQIIKELGLTANQTRPFSRCLQCNLPIVTVSKNRLWGRIPDYIFETHDHFNQCPQCDRVFWPGSHTRRSLAKIRQLFDF